MCVADVLLLTLDNAAATSLRLTDEIFTRGRSTSLSSESLRLMAPTFGAQGIRT